jgi:hypothetical protein
MSSKIVSAEQWTSASHGSSIIYVVRSLSVLELPLACVAVAGSHTR